jgi:hypothetical protein
LPSKFNTMPGTIASMLMLALLQSAPVEGSAVWLHATGHRNV